MKDAPDTENVLPPKIDLKAKTLSAPPVYPQPTAAGSPTTAPMANGGIRLTPRPFTPAVLKTPGSAHPEAPIAHPPPLPLPVSRTPCPIQGATPQLLPSARSYPRQPSSLRSRFLLASDGTSTIPPPNQHLNGRHHGFPCPTNPQAWMPESERSRFLPARTRYPRHKRKTRNPKKPHKACCPHYRHLRHPIPNGRHRAYRWMWHLAPASVHHRQPSSLNGLPPPAALSAFKPPMTRRRMTIPTAPWLMPRHKP